jgi:LacI family transcriptional regulator
MRKTRRPTLGDIGRELGLSAATVSRVLNNSVLVKEETRRRILAGAQRLGYVKQARGRHRARAIPTIALVLPRTRDTYRPLFYDPAGLIESITGAFAPGRVNIVTTVAGQDIGGARKLGGVDGWVFAFQRPAPGLAASFRDAGVPFVAINRTGPNLPSVSCDHGAGMAALVRRLLATGRPVRPAYLGLAPVAEVSRLRLAALDAACSTLGVPFGTGHAHEARSLEEIDAELVRGLVHSGRTALVCFNDLAAIAALNAAAAAGLRVPEDLMVTGFDNTPVMSIAPVPIDTIDLAVEEMGAAGAEWLRSRIFQRDEEPLSLLVAGRYVPGRTIEAASHARRRK